MNDELEKRRYGLAERRKEVCDLLAQAFAGDQIELEDYERRLDLVNSADSIEEVDSVIHDFPATVRAPAVPEAEPPATVPEVETKLAIVGDQHIDHHNFEAGSVRSIALVGDVTVHLERIPPRREPVVLTVFSLIGDTTVIVPRGMRVRNKVVSLLGDNEYHENTEPDVPEVPGSHGTCILKGFSLLGDIVIQEEGYQKPGFFRSLLKR
jgi:hypothetical protein